jgi:hypothetical protein
MSPSERTANRIGKVDYFDAGLFDINPHWRVHASARRSEYLVSLLIRAIDDLSALFRILWGRVRFRTKGSSASSLASEPRLP